MGESWLRAMQSGVADANPYDGIEAGKLNLWTYDSYHASTHGYYLQALVIFGTLTGKDPRSLGDNECSAYELGMSRAEVRALQQVAFDQLASLIKAPTPPNATQKPGPRGAASRRGRWIYERETDGALLLTYDSTRWTKWLAGGAVVMLITAVYDYLIGARGDERVIGLLAGAATLGGIALIMLEQTRFRVDPVTRLVEWDQRWGFRRRGRASRRSTRSSTSASRCRLATRVFQAAGWCSIWPMASLLPVTAGYKPDLGDEISNAAERLRLQLGHRPPTVDESARLLVAQGRTIEAVKLLVEKESLSLTDARQRVDRVEKSVSHVPRDDARIGLRPVSWLRRLFARTRRTRVLGGTGIVPVAAAGGADFSG